MTSTQKHPRFSRQIEKLKRLIPILQKTPSIQEKIGILNDLAEVQDYLKSSSATRNFMAGSTLDHEYAFKSVIAIGQASIVFNQIGIQGNPDDQMENLLQQLINIESFYADLGGIIGYHLTVLELLDVICTENSEQDLHYIKPAGLQLDGFPKESLLHFETKPNEIRLSIKHGLESLPITAEIYPIGGAGDRLNLTDPTSGTPLPAAMLPFEGRSLLEGLIRDVQAREYLYFKLYGKQLITPIAMMTSPEKNNHVNLLNVLKENNWFGRPPKTFFLFTQPLVPVITSEGNWSMSKPLKMTLKPGGHGVIWKLAREKGLFSWLFDKGYTKAIVRQINNPVAGTDNAILALIGEGCMHEKALGFISCERLVHAAEGVNVIVEKSVSEGFQYCLTNIEYTDFVKKKIIDRPSEEGGAHSQFPANTNILFIDLKSILEALKICPLPGQIVNMKTKVPYIDSKSYLSQTEGGRLESTMQNIADCLSKTFSKRLDAEELKNLLPSFILFNRRSKTISTTKTSYKPGESPVATPEQAFYDILSNNALMLQDYCHLKTPDMNEFKDYLRLGPSFSMTYHPALGPLYSVISQKIRGGRMAPRSELKLEIAEADIYELDLQGSLLIEALLPLGQFDKLGVLRYGEESCCRLHHVKVRNLGIDYDAKNDYWKGNISRKETLQIKLNPGAEFWAENVLFEGNCFYEVPSQHRLTITQGPTGELNERLEKLSQSSGYWHYAFDSDDHIVLNCTHAKK
jgi:hypothetical protein